MGRSCGYRWKPTDRLSADIGKKYIVSTMDYDEMREPYPSLMSDFADQFGNPRPKFQRKIGRDQASHPLWLSEWPTDCASH